MTESINLAPGSKDWKKWRKLATTTIPGKQSALYFLNAKIRGLEPLVPMTYRAHLGMCLFASLHPQSTAVYYTQPRSYNPDYSEGVKVIDGQEQVFAYCLRLGGRNLY